MDVIVNCAGYTNVDKAEDEPAMAELLNSVAVGNLARVAVDRGATLIHISTDYVFQGDRPEPCREDWPTFPLGVYGSTKLSGEKEIEKSGCGSILFRTAWLYSPYGKNFVKTIRQLTAERPSIKVVFDQIGTPTYARDLAKVIVNIIDNNLLRRPSANSADMLAMFSPAIRRNFPRRRGVRVFRSWTKARSSRCSESKSLIGETL